MFDIFLNVLFIFIFVLIIGFVYWVVKGLLIVDWVMVFDVIGINIIVIMVIILIIFWI